MEVARFAGENFLGYVALLVRAIFSVVYGGEQNAGDTMRQELCQVFFFVADIVEDFAESYDVGGWVFRLF